MCVFVCVCLCFDLMDLFVFVDLSGFVLYIYIFTIQHLSSDGERYSLLCEIRKANQSAWFDQNPLYETIAC